MSGDLDLFMSALPDTHACIAQKERIAEAQAALTDTATELHERDVQIRAEHIPILAHVTDALPGVLKQRALARKDAFMVL
jgi:hypothetical protein